MQQQTGGASGRRQTAVVTCPKSMIGRVIGRNGETIKALQTYTGALIQIDQTCDPTRIAISGTPQSLSLALSMVHDIVRGTFKGFALLRQATGHSSRGINQLTTKPVYAPGYGLIPPSQLYGAEAPAGGILHPGGALLAGPRPPGAPGPAAYPAQILSAPPLAAAPPQFVLGVQPMPVAGPALHTPVYNVIGGPTFGAPVYLSPYEFTAGPGPSSDLLLLQDGASLLGSSAPGGTAGGTGSRLFHHNVAGGSGPRSSPGGGLLSVAGGGAAANSGAGGAADMLTQQPMAVFSQHGGGGPHDGGHRGGGGGGGGAAAGLLSAGTLVVDAEGGLYTYTMNG